MKATAQGTPRSNARPTILRRMAPWVERTFRPGGAILAYHRITHHEWNPLNTCVTAEHFSEHLEVLRKFAVPRRAVDIARQASQGNRPACEVAITFDDGYRDNLEIAKPILEKHDYPATVFVTTEPLQTGLPFYWDELEHLIFAPDVLPSTLELVAGRQYSWQLDSSIKCRRDLYRELAAVMSYLTPDDRRATIATLRSALGVSPDLRSSPRLTMNTEELARLQDGGLIDLGAHTVNHAWLPACTAEDQYRELLDSRRHLEAVTGKPTTTFAYPYGVLDGTTLDCVRAAGYEFAYTTQKQDIRGRVNPLAVPRFVVYDIDGDRFEELLREHVFGLRRWDGPAWAGKRLLRKLRNDR